MTRQLQRLPGSYLLTPLLAPLVMNYVQWIIGHRLDDIAPMNTYCKISCPVLLVHGDKDKTIPLADMHMIADNCPDKKSEILVIKGAGHDSLHKLRDHAQELVNFLKRRSF